MNFGTWLPSADFFNNIISNPALIITIILALFGVFFNGWTDAPNSIATCVSTRCLKPRAALVLSATFDFMGTFLMTFISGRVTSTMASMLNFGNDSNVAVIALCAGLVAVVVWALAAWAFGLPSSQSHSLIAGITGAAIYVSGIDGINFSEWKKVIYGLFVAIFLGFFLGYAYTKLVRLVFAKADRSKVNGGFRISQVFSAMFMSFMHGAQDGQKFIGVLFLGACISTGQSASAVSVPYWMALMVAIVMSCGCVFCSSKILKSVGMDMVKLEKYEGFSADISGASCVLVATLTGLPISTSHAKTAAIMGTGASKRIKNVNWSLSKKLIYSWFLVFPVCGIIGYLLTMLAVNIF